MNHFSTLKRHALSTDPSSSGVKSEDANHLEVAVPPCIARNVEGAKRCEMDDMLRLFLLDCVDDQSPTTRDPAVLLETCLQHVLPISDGKVLKNGVDSAHIRTCLESYSKALDQETLRSTFVCAANHALHHLQDLDHLDGLRKPSGQLVFQVNGEVNQPSWYREESLVCKPDVVLLPIAAVEIGGMFDSRFEGTLEKPVEGPGWREVRTVVELTIGPTARYPPENHHKAQGDRADDQPLKNSAPRKRKLSSLETELHSSNEGSEPDLKKQRVKTNPDADSFEIRSTSDVEEYGIEMFASHAGRQHVICLTIVGDQLYLWRYDRQGAIQCSMNFIQDLPRFLVLLLAMQRFQNRHWGLNPRIDPDFGTLPTASTTMLIEDPKEGLVDIVLDCSPHSRLYYHSLEGRATDLYPVTSLKFPSKRNLVVKFFWCEESRASDSEPEILQRVYEIAEKEPDVRNHVPAMVFHRAFSESSTALIRKRLRLPTKGSRVLYVIVFEELMRITKLDGDDLLKCWWDAVKCHLALWKNGVHHRDVSAPNLMYKIEDDDAVVGVLNDFDMATIAEPGPDPSRSKEHVGTIPFMSLELLADVVDRGPGGDSIQHLYAHDAESFVWVLTWICLHYARGRQVPNSALDEWLRGDPQECRMKKIGFLTYLEQSTPGAGHENSWLVARNCLYALWDKLHYGTAYNESYDSDWFRKLLEDPYHSVVDAQAEK